MTIPNLICEVAFDGDPGTPYEQIVLNDGPIDRFRLTDPVGTGYPTDDGLVANPYVSIRDTSGNGDTGIGTVTFGVADTPLTGEPSQTCMQTASGGFLNISYSPVPDLSGSFSVEAWFKKSGAPSTKGVIFGQKNGIGLWADPTGNLAFQFYNGSAVIYTALDGFHVCDGNWNHCLYIFDSVTGFHKVYCNLNAVIFDGYDAPSGNTNELWGVGGTFGTSTSSPYFPLDGKYAECALYLDALTPQEIDLHYYGKDVASEYAWSDISDKVMSAQTKRGRQYELDRIEAGTARVVLDNSDRDFDPTNTSSPYSPGVLPMRRIRMRAYGGTADGSVTEVGDVMTNATRTAAVDGDGETADDSYGFYPAATNLAANGGFETNTTGWTQVSATLTRDATWSKFGTHSGKVVTSNLVANEGAYITFTGQAFQSYNGSAWMRVASGSATARLRITSSDGLTTIATGSTATLSSTPQRVYCNSAFVTSTDTYRLYVETDVQQSVTFWIDGVQAESGSDSPYVETDGATAARAAGYVTVPATQADESQMWFAARFKVVDSAFLTGGQIFAYGSGSDYLRVGVSTFTFFETKNAYTVREAGGSYTLAAVSHTFASGDHATIIGTFTQTEVGVSLNGAAFTTVENLTIPSVADAAFDIGNNLGGSVYWAACGIGTLSDADASTINGFGDTAPTLADFPSSARPTFVWAGTSDSYSGTTFAPLFTGYVERWPQEWPGPGDTATTTITCVDGFELLQQAQYSGTLASAVSGAQVGDVLDAAGWSYYARDLATGQSTMASQTFALDADEAALSLIQDISDSELGIFFIAADGTAVFQDRLTRSMGSYQVSQGTFGDLDPDENEYTDLVPSYDKDRVVNDWRVTANGSSSPQQWIDGASIRLYLRRSQTRSTLLSSDSDALNQAQALVAHTAAPSLRFDQITIEPVADDALFSATLVREISDRITVNRRPPGGGPEISVDAFIEQIEWDITDDQGWKVTWQLSPTSPWAYMVLDTAALDGGVLGY